MKLQRGGHGGWARQSDRVGSGGAGMVLRPESNIRLQASINAGVPVEWARISPPFVPPAWSCGSVRSIHQQGGRDHALLLFLYNSGARAAEAASLRVSNLQLGTSPSVRILGKGNKKAKALASVDITGLPAAVRARSPLKSATIMNFMKQL